MTQIKISYRCQSAPNSEGKYFSYNVIVGNGNPNSEELDDIKRILRDQIKTEPSASDMEKIRFGLSLAL